MFAFVPPVFDRGLRSAVAPRRQSFRSFRDEGCSIAPRRRLFRSFREDSCSDRSATTVVPIAPRRELFRALRDARCSDRAATTVVPIAPGRELFRALRDDRSFPRAAPRRPSFLSPRDAVAPSDPPRSPRATAGDAVAAFGFCRAQGFFCCGDEHGRGIRFRWLHGCRADAHRDDSGARRLVRQR
jgi:hypothetical protein